MTSLADYRKCHSSEFPEYAFVGRSNVGKSSLLNMITGKKNLAKVSSTPGKTKLINYFLINEKWYLVDLPGYGYAKYSKKDQSIWSVMTKDYILKRANLTCLFVLIDSRLKPQKPDTEFMRWLGVHEVPFVMVFTKTDKLKKAALVKNLEGYKKYMFKTWEELPPIFVTSAKTKEGKDNMLAFIEETRNS